MRLTLATPYLAISSNSPSTMAAGALSASIRTARWICCRALLDLAAMVHPSWWRAQDHTAIRCTKAIDRLTTGGTSLEQLVQRVSQLLVGVGFVQQRIDQAFLLLRIAEAAGEQNGQFRSALAYVVRQLQAVGAARHHDIAE